MNIWGILNINPTKNKDEIKKAYLNKLSVVHPEDDEEGFKLLRRSYEEALKEADKDEVIDEDNTPIGIWIKKVNEVYDKFSLRINEEAWKNLLNEDVCYGIDTKEDASEKLLEFLMDNFRFPQKIWILLNNYFEWTEQKEELYEKFPYEFIDYVDNRIKYIDVLNYELFENIDDNKNYDQWIESYYKIRRELNERNLDEAKKSLDIVNIELNIIGKETLPKEPLLFVVNHSSMLDSFILTASVERPIGCVIADEPVWRNIPIFKEWAKLLRCVYVNRKNNREGIKSIAQASQNILTGQSMAVFPEGDLTWIKEPNSLVSEFRSGALKIAYKAKCPIVPLVIKNSKDTYEGYQPIGKINSVPIEVEFLEPIYDHIENPRLKSSVLGENIKNKMINTIENFRKSNKTFKEF